MTNPLTPHAAGRAHRGAQDALAQLAAWPSRRWIVAIIAAVLAALAIGIPTGVVPSSLYHRMTPVTWWDYPIWAVSTILVGLTAGTYVRVGPRPAKLSGGGRTAGASLLSVFAVGCPICNKLVVALIGITGALNYWAPIQPIIGVISVGLLGAGFALRMRNLTACPVRSA